MASSDRIAVAADRRAARWRSGTDRPSCKLNIGASLYQVGLVNNFAMNW